MSAVVPITLVAGAWGVAISASPGSDTIDAKQDDSRSGPGTPAITDVPTDAFDQPMAGEVKKRQSGHHPLAGVSLAGKHAAKSVAASLKSSPLPTPALDAYHDAAKVMADVKASCELDWTLVAAIGRVESDHGQYAGSTVATDGESSPRIIGIPLDGSNNTAAIRDTDDGKYDGDTTWDRAVGPMQFIPSTWDLVGVDGNGDGQKDPNNIYDAALATSVYLCAGDEDLSTREGASEAVFSYNHSNSYVADVLAIADAYQHGDFEEAPGVLPQTDIVPRGTMFDPSDVEQNPGQEQRLKSLKQKSDTGTSGRDKADLLKPMHRETHKNGKVEKARHKQYQVEPASPDGLGEGPIKQQDLETVPRGDAKPADPKGTSKPDHTKGFAQHHQTAPGKHRQQGSGHGLLQQQSTGDSTTPKGAGVDVRPDETVDDATQSEQAPKHKGQDKPEADPQGGPGVDVRPKHRADDKTTKPEAKDETTKPKAEATPTEPKDTTSGQDATPKAPDQATEPKAQDTTSGQDAKPKAQDDTTKPQATDQATEPKAEAKPAPDDATVRPHPKKDRTKKDRRSGTDSTPTDPVEYTSDYEQTGPAIEQLLADFSLFWSVPAQNADLDTL